MYSHRIAARATVLRGDVGACAGLVVHHHRLPTDLPAQLSAMMARENRRFHREKSDHEPQRTNSGWQFEYAIQVCFLIAPKDGQFLLFCQLLLL